jgi:uncharacterized C2H2 Zn-finger protein
MNVLQCPECKLRFRNESELDQHLKDEHPEFHSRKVDMGLTHHPKSRNKPYESSN